ncbi:MAG: ABC transporter ATP-binding protein [Cellulosilyticaceae bacterium]
MGIIQVKNLNIQFKDKKVLDGINVTLEAGKIYGLLGKNGIGKSTLLNTIVGGISPKTGEVLIEGINPYKNASILEKVCIVREQEFLQPDMKVKDIFKIYQIFFPEYDQALQERLVNYFDLPVKKAYRTYSRGMKTLVANIIGLCSRAEIIIFDEPTIGLDAVNRSQFYEILLEVYAKDPKTIILSTHQIDEVENLLEHVVMLDKGTVCIDEEVEAVRAKAYRLKGKKEALQKLEIIQGKKAEQQFGGSEVYSCYGELSHRDEQTIEAENITKEAMTLQELFVALTKGEGFSL